MKFSDTAKNLMLDALDESIAAGMKFGSLHTAYSATGANEVTGGSPGGGGGLVRPGTRQE